MIIKSFEIDKINLKNNHYFLFYGENQGHKSEILEKKFKKNYSENIYTYEESEITSNEEDFFNTILIASISSFVVFWATIT